MQRRHHHHHRSRRLVTRAARQVAELWREEIIVDGERLDFAAPCGRRRRHRHCRYNIFVRARSVRHRCITFYARAFLTTATVHPGSVRQQLSPPPLPSPPPLAARRSPILYYLGKGTTEPRRCVKFALPSPRAQRYTMLSSILYYTRMYHKSLARRSLTYRNFTRAVCVIRFTANQCFNLPSVRTRSRLT